MYNSYVLCADSRFFSIGILLARNLKTATTTPRLGSIIYRAGIMIPPSVGSSMRIPLQALDRDSWATICLHIVITILLFILIPQERLLPFAFQRQQIRLPLLLLKLVEPAAYRPLLEHYAF